MDVQPLLEKGAAVEIDQQFAAAFANFESCANQLVEAAETFCDAFLPLMATAVNQDVAFAAALTERQIHACLELASREANWFHGYVVEQMSSPSTSAKQSTN